MTLVAIKEKSVPTIDDEFAKDLGVESVAELKTKLKESLQRERDQASKAEVEKQVIDRLLEGNEFAVPPTMVQRQAEYLLSRQTERMGQQGMSQEDISKLVERLKPDAQKEAEREVRLAYILNALAEAENISVTQEEVTARINDLLQRSQPHERKQLEKALKGGYRDRIESELRESKLFAFILDSAKVKEVPAEEKK